MNAARKTRDEARNPAPAWGIYESPSNALKAHVLALVASHLPGTPQGALFLRWRTRERALLVESSSGSRLATVVVDAGTVRFSERLTHTDVAGATLPLDFAGDPCWTPESPA